MSAANPNQPQPIRLNGLVIFLSARVPIEERGDRFRRIDNAPVVIEEAVVALSRAVFAAGGTLVLAADPSISPLVASVTREYAVPSRSREDSSVSSREYIEQPKLVMFQSTVLRDRWDKWTSYLSRESAVKINWIDAGNEATNMMRKTMIRETNPIAMVVIGGMEETEEEIKVFAQTWPNKRIFAYGTTGGVAASLEDLHVPVNLGQSDFRSWLIESDLSPRVSFPDEKGTEQLRRYWREHSNADPRSSHQSESSSSPQFLEGAYYVPYTLVAHDIISQIAGR